MAYHFDSYDGSLVVDGFDKGIADDPFSGIANIRNANITAIPGEASVNFSTVSQTFASSSGNVTGTNAGSDVLTVDQDIASAMAATFTGLDAVGVATGTVYWISAITTRTFKLYSNPTLTSSVIDITGSGTGTFATINMGKPINKAFDKVTTNYFIVDTNGRTWSPLSNGTWTFLGNTTLTNAHGNGLITYGGYLFVFRDTAVDYMKISTYAWTYAWSGAGTLISAGGSANSHQALQSYNDSKIYYCDSNHIGTFYQNQAATTFDPTDPTTYTFTGQILDLPNNDIAQCLTELGSNLLVGGQMNAIYPWDRIVRTAGSAGNLSVLSFYSTPILLAESYVSKMITVNTNTYILAGNRGRIYVTNGSQAQLFKKIPDHISGTVEPYYNWGDLTFGKKQLYFGVSATTNNAVAINQYGGLWAIDLDSGALRLVNRLSYGTYAGVASVIIPIYVTPSSVPSGVGLFIGWDSGASTFGMDTSSSNPYSNSETTIDSDLIPIGTYTRARNFGLLEYKLTRPLVSGESVVIKTRTVFNTSDTGFTAALTDSTTGNFSLSGNSNIANAQWIQLQAVLTSTNGSPSYVRLKEMRIGGLIGPTAANSQQISL